MSLWLGGAVCLLLASILVLIGIEVEIVPLRRAAAASNATQAATSSHDLPSAGGPAAVSCTVRDWPYAETTRPFEVTAVVSIERTLIGRSHTRMAKVIWSMGAAGGGL